MRKYFLFAINEQAYQLYKNDISNLYKILESLAVLEKHDYTYGLHVYNEICNIIDTGCLKQLIISKYGHPTKLKDNMFLIKNEIIHIRYSCVTINTNNNIARTFIPLKYYYNKIMVCDFKNKDYFWLDDIYNKNLINA